MSQTQRQPEESRREASAEGAEAPKRTYYPPQLRELGHLADLTGTNLVSGSVDADPPYQSA
jgi:hypothetical protein